MAASLAVHAGLGLALLIGFGRDAAFQVNAPQTVMPVTLETLRPAEPEPSPRPPGGAPPPAVKIRPPKSPPPPQVVPVAAVSAPQPVPMPSLSDSELAGARTAGSGSGEGGGAGSGEGAGCDMVRRLQEVLRRDPQVRAAAAGASRAAGGRTILVWNGDWVRDPAQDGKGLAGVRQAIAVEVAFAPESCRAEAMQGLVVLSLGEGRLALGRGAWRWTDLLGARRR